MTLASNVGHEANENIIGKEKFSYLLLKWGNKTMMTLASNLGLKEDVSRDFQSLFSSGPLINGLENFLIRFRFHRDIRIFKKPYCPHVSGTISKQEARAALREHKGKIWHNLTLLSSCVRNHLQTGGEGRLEGTQGQHLAYINPIVPLCQEPSPNMRRGPPWGNTRAISGRLSQSVSKPGKRR